MSLEIFLLVLSYKIFFRWTVEFEACINIADPKNPRVLLVLLVLHLLEAWLRPDMTLGSLLTMAFGLYIPESGYYGGHCNAYGHKDFIMLLTSELLSYPYIYGPLIFTLYSILTWFFLLIFGFVQYVECFVWCFIAATDNLRRFVVSRGSKSRGEKKSFVP